MKYMNLATILLLGCTSAFKLTMYKKDESIAQMGSSIEAEVEAEAKLAMMTHVTISNTHKSMKMDRNHVLAKQIALAFKEAVKATKKGETAQQEGEEEAKDAKEKKKEDAAADDKEKKTTEGDADADELASKASKEKADTLFNFAKGKVKAVIDNYKELDANIQQEMESLEKVLLNVKINANFDSESSEDLEWVTGEVEKILNDTPQLKSLETKLKMVDDVDKSLDDSVAGLKKVIQISKMMSPKKAKKVEPAKKPEVKKEEKKEEKKEAPKEAAPAEAPKSEEAQKSTPNVANATAAVATTQPSTPAAASAIKTEPAKGTPQPQKPTAPPAPAAQPAQQKAQVFEFTIGGGEDQENAPKDIHFQAIETDSKPIDASFVNYKKQH